MPARFPVKVVSIKVPVVADIAPTSLALLLMKFESVTIELHCHNAALLSE